MNDYIISAIAAGGSVRAYAATTAMLVEEARRLHETSGVATAALGRTLTAAAIMSRMSKGEKYILTIQIKGDGPLGGIVAVSDAFSNVRGYVSDPSVELPLNNLGKFDVASAVGRNGYLNVIRDLGLKEPYIGYVDLYTGEIGEDIAYYYAVSEQIPSVVSLGVLVSPDKSVITAGGFIIQLMPDAGEIIIGVLEDRARNLRPITSLYQEGMTPEGILEALLGDMDLKITGKYLCSYVCNCTRERMERNLMSLGSKELIELALEQHGAELQCHFCNRKYNFSEDELISLVNIEE